MNKFKRGLALFAAAVMAMSFTACGSSKDDGKYHIGIVQQMEHVALDEATRGFKQAVIDKLGEDKVVFDYQNAQGEQVNCGTIANKFVSDRVDLIMANATTALQSAAQATSTIPIVGTSITDYITAGVVDSNDKPGRNVTGASDLAPIDKQIELLRALCPDAKKVGILYCSAEPNSKFQSDKAEAALKAAGITSSVYTVADSNEIQAVLTNAVAEVDAIYIPTDNTIANTMEAVRNVTVPKKIPVICGEEGMCSKGGLATLSISYYSMGYSAGEMAAEILADGKKPADMAIRYATETTKKYNKTIAEEIGWTIPAGLTPIE